MRSVILVLLATLAVAAFAQSPQPQRIYTALPTDVPPELRQGRTFVPLRTIAQEFGASVSWFPQQQLVLIQRPSQPDIRLTINSRTVRVGEDTVTLDVAPYINQGRTMVPLRFIAETYDIPVEYNTPTTSVYLYRDNRVYVLPLQSTRSGVYIFTPTRAELVRNPILVQGQANVFEGNLIVQVQDSQGRVLGQTIATAGMGAFYPYSVRVYYNLPSEDPANGRIVVFSMNGKGDGKILAQDSVQIMLASTI